MSNFQINWDQWQLCAKCKNYATMIFRFHVPLCRKHFTHLVLAFKWIESDLKMFEKLAVEDWDNDEYKGIPTTTWKYTTGKPLRRY